MSDSQLYHFTNLIDQGRWNLSCFSTKLSVVIVNNSDLKLFCNSDILLFYYLTELEENIYLI